ncbi:MAG: HEAT repeat domain-containing protein [Bdellovibrionota bacterium]
MKKWIGGLVSLLVLVLLIFVFTRKVERESASDSDSAGGVDAGKLVGPLAGDEALYAVTIKTTQRSSGKEGTVVSLTGVLAQRKQGDNDYVSEWREISSLVLLDQAVDAVTTQSLIKKPMISSLENGELHHYLPKDFPSVLLTFQLSFLNKFLVPVKADGTQAILRTEKDEAGTVKVQYDFTTEGQNQRVVKTLDRYVQDAVKIDAEDNMIRYVLTAEHRVITIKGLLTTHYREPQSIHFTTSIDVSFKGSSPSPSLSASKETLDKTDLQRAAARAQEAARPKDAMSYADAMKKVDTIDEKMDGKEVYEVFSAIKADLIAHPENAQVLIDKILSTKERSEGAQRKMAVLFGVLAQSQTPEISDALAKLANDCPDNFCKVQAMIGLNDHPVPTAQSASEMLRIASQTNDTEISGTALLAAGSVAKKLPDDTTVSKALVATFNDSSKATNKDTVVAAMGNHGSADYFGPLLDSLKSADASTRASAAYSMRYLPNAEVNPTLIGVMKSDKSVEVQREAVKAMAYRNLSGEEYLTVAQQAMGSPDRDLQQDAARILVSAYRDNPAAAGPALDAMRNGATNPDIKNYIEGELKPATSTPGGPGLQ